MTGELQGRVVSVVEGAGGRLFMGGAPGFDARALYGAPCDPEAMRRVWARPLERLARVCGEIGARLVLVFAPDAHAVHPDELPPGWPYAEPSPADAVAGLARERGIAVVHPRDALRAAARGPLEVMRRTDSHWSAYGAYAAYRELAEALALPAHGVVGPERVDYAWRTESGDLGAGLDPPRRAPVACAAVADARARAVLDRLNARRHAVRVTEVDDPSLPSGVMLRDSYATEMGAFVAEGFRRLASLGADNLLFEDVLREERPQVVILERAERTLPFGLVDPEPLTGWREHWPAPGDGAREVEAREAEMAAHRSLLAGDTPGALERARGAVSLQPTADRHALLARALEAAGVEGAADAWEAAHLAAPERWSFALRLGAQRLRQGRDADARDLFARACVEAPWRGEAYEHFGYAALRLRDFELARYALERATAAAPHAAGGWLWLAELQAARGDGEAALRTLAVGLEACPGEPSLSQARARLQPRPAA